MTPGERIAEFVSGYPTRSIPEAALNRATSAVIDYVGVLIAGLDESSSTLVRRWVEDSGFRVTVRQVRITGRPAGTVVGQLPLAGYPIRSNDIVELTVAR